MSTGYVLEGVRDWLRTKNSWTAIQCGVQFECKPLGRAGNFYIAIDDAGVETGPDNTHALTEVFSIEVATWRRTGHLPADFQGDMAIPEDRYLPEISTLHDLERRVICHLHNQWPLVAFLNKKYGLPDDGRGDKFSGQLVYRGRSRIETYTMGEGPNATMIGRKLRFRGLRRIQAITTAIG